MNIALALGAGLAGIVSFASAAQASPADTQTLPEINRAAVAQEGAALVAAPVRDGTEFCAGYATLSGEGRAVFWETFLGAVSASATGGDTPKNTFHVFSMDARRPVIDRGYFQIPIESASRSIYGCTAPDPVTLADPHENAVCAVRILTHWVKKDQAIYGRYDGHWRGAARFWPTLRHASVRAAIAAQMASVPGCATT